jgi:hypothetical protein
MDAAERRLTDALKAAGRAGIVVGDRLFVSVVGSVVDQLEHYPQRTTVVELAKVAGLGGSA